MAAEGLITTVSKFGQQQTLERLKAEIGSRHLTLFAEIDHAKGAADVGLRLPPTVVLVFGNARGGTPLMQANQTVGIDLPLRALTWQDGNGKVWIAYNDPVWIAERHSLPTEAKTIAGQLREALSALVKAAAGIA